MRTSARWLYGLAVLVALAACIGGVALMTRTGCVPNPYNDTFGTDLCSGKTHPLAGIGAAVLLGGLLNTAVIGTVGYLCRAVADLRGTAPTAGLPSEDEPDPGYTPDGPMPTMYGTKD